MIPDPIPAFTLPWMGLPPGSWTDDTAMARNLWLSLTEHDGALAIDDVLDRHLRWLASSPPDVGTLTRRVLAGWAGGEADPARAYVHQRGPEVSAGNGSVMYCAPLGAARSERPDTLLDDASALSALTHWDGRCRTACVAITRAVASLVRGVPPEAAVRAAVEDVIELEGGEELEFLVAEAGRSRPLDGPDQGFTLFTAGIALQVTGEGRGLADGLRHVVSLGGDTDTNAAVAGALLGATYGTAALPAAWLARLAEADTIRAEATALTRVVVSRGRGPNGGPDPPGRPTPP